MKKDKFLFEYIDNCLYIAGLGCMIRENYLASDCTDEYIRYADELQMSLKKFDCLYAEVQKGNISESQMDEQLILVVQKHKQETLKSIGELLEGIAKKTISHDILQDMLESTFEHISADSLEKFILELRKMEEGY